jgi:hypothetical protein
MNNQSDTPNQQLTLITKNGSIHLGLVEEISEASSRTHKNSINPIPGCPVAGISSHYH